METAFAIFLRPARVAHKIVLKRSVVQLTILLGVLGQVESLV